MGKGIDFFRNITNDIIDREALIFGVSKVIDVLLELNLDDERICQLLVKHFNILYSDAKTALKEAKNK